MKVLRKTLGLLVCTLLVSLLVGTAAAQGNPYLPCIWVGVDSKAETIKSLWTEFNREHAGKLR